MSSKRKSRYGDPRKAGGTIAGPGGPHDRDSVIIDSTNAVLLDHTNVCQMETNTGEHIIAMALSGRINKTPERTEIVYLLGADGAAAIITELIALGGRMGPEFGTRLNERINELIAQGATLPPPADA
jgi:hypothetical protein